MAIYFDHKDPEVQKALVRLCDALCSWERATGRDSVLILREFGGYEFRACSGKPQGNSSTSDAVLFEGIGWGLMTQ